MSRALNAPLDLPTCGLKESPCRRAHGERAMATMKTVLLDPEGNRSVVRASMTG